MQVQGMTNPPIDPSVLASFFNYWQNTFLAFGVFAAVFVAYWTVINDRKNLKLNGLNTVFQKLNDPKSREVRRNVLSAYYDYLFNEGKQTEYSCNDFLEKHLVTDLVTVYPDLEEDVENLKSDFEQIAVMTKNGLVDEKSYFDAYYGSMLRCYGALHGNIEKSRNKLGTKHYTFYFQKQSEKAVKYWKKNHKENKIKYYGRERTDFTLQRFEEGDVWKIRILHPKDKIENCQVFADRLSLLSDRHTDNNPHTIAEGGGDNFYFPEHPTDNPTIIVKSNGHMIKKVSFADIELTMP